MLDADVPAGARLALTMDAASRRPLLAALAGYLPVTAGRARVADGLLPSQPSRVARRVTLVDLDPVRLPAGVTLATLADERLAAARSRRTVDSWLSSLGSRLRAADEPELARVIERVDPDVPLAALDPATRALVASALGTIDEAPIVLVDAGHLPFSTVTSADRLLEVAAPTAARILVGDHVAALPADGRAAGRLRPTPTTRILDSEAISS